MKYLITLCLIVLMSCNSGTNSDTNNNPDPEVVNPVVDAIPEDMKIKNDSVVVPDTAKIRKDSLIFSDTLK